MVTHVPGWLGVMTPDAGNNRLGWIAQNATALSRVSWELKVSLAARRLTVLHHGKVVAQYTVAIGAPGSPTPTGRFAVTDRIVTQRPSWALRLLHPRALGPCAPRAPGLGGGDPDRDPLDAGERDHRRGREPRLRPGDAPRGTMAARPHPARNPDADQQQLSRSGGVPPSGDARPADPSRARLGHALSGASHPRRGGRSASASFSAGRRALATADGRSSGRTLFT